MFTKFSNMRIMSKRNTSILLYKYEKNFCQNGKENYFFVFVHNLSKPQMNAFKIYIP